MTVFYKFEGKMYINITNGCPCRCVFCLRDNGDSIKDNDSLWLEHEPSYEEIIAAYEAFDKSGITDAVFCGYGEPTVRADMMVRVAQYIKDNSDMRIRLNSNGLVKLIHPDFDITSLKGLIDSVSISLNAPDACRYNEVTRPSFGEKSFDIMLDFAREMKNVCGNVAFTVVDIISEDEISRCQSLADSMGIPLRVRHYITDNESYT
ncbi:MAG: TIGR04100 family radical SAM protein [Oscillospiraceae bacterium]|nr:TIGR04100 family radical SAM protein [Oscillospiraceae bacterium]